MYVRRFYRCRLCSVCIYELKHYQSYTYITTNTYTHIYLYIYIYTYIHLPPIYYTYLSANIVFKEEANLEAKDVTNPNNNVFLTNILILTIYVYINWVI